MVKKPVLKVKLPKDLGHFWLGYNIRILGHLQMSDHLVNFDQNLYVVFTVIQLHLVKMINFPHLYYLLLFVFFAHRGIW